ncbi:Response regulator receiver domain-containing protein [Tangfeifania diversioriginum]|uniref:Response regulator receiver domain-containing protein n=1 Tax=Tangfeifania diversioriginum TaxID=1168035 RepID=A0A1M6J9W4_9BACT|nr:response regulator [Tangfeifania diversioriginum]SHJ43507.1 Response regulator receiver domain-containing protein [Tangfeifania diversioriginum]
MVKKVLVIEDDEAVLIMVSEILQNENFDVITASGGIRGVELAIENCPEVILCDIRLPDIDGYEVLKKLSRDNRYLRGPFIFMTALRERENYRKAMELGADDYLPKPFSPKELVEAIFSRLLKYSRIESNLDQKVKEIENQLNTKTQNIHNEVDENGSFISPASSKNEILVKQLKEKEMELVKETFNAIETNNTLLDLRNEINRELKNPALKKQSKQILTDLKRKTKKHTMLWNNQTIFQLKFNQAYPNFISKLNTRFSGLTQYEIVFISAHLMGLNTMQLSDLFCISDDSVRKSRYRVKKKLGLKKEDDFFSFIHALNIGKRNHE